MSQTVIEQDISKLEEQLRTLRLPHKLNQYRAYEKKLLSLKNQAQSIPSESDQYTIKLDQLQSQLDNSVLCGVNECFLCGQGASSEGKL